MQLSLMKESNTNQIRRSHEEVLFGSCTYVDVLTRVGVSARAQSADAVVVSVPFEFVAGGATLPAGEYRIDRVNPGVNRELAIRGYNNGTHSCFLWRSTMVLPISQAELRACRRKVLSEQNRNTGRRLYHAGLS